MLTCQEITELVTDYLEDRVSVTDRLRFRLHVGMCLHCRTYLHQMKQTIRILGSLHGQEIPADVRDELLQWFRDWKR
jgi:predicted anti-sigma-YlaC factor YlaD